MSPSYTRRQLLATGAVALSGCVAPKAFGEPTPRFRSTSTVSHEPPAYESDWSPPTTPPTAEPVSPTTLVNDLEIPWDLDFTPEGDVFITERVGRVKRFSGEELSTAFEPADAIDARSVPPDAAEQEWWIRGGEGGVLGIAVHPNYPRPAHVFVYYTVKTWFGLGRENRLVRFDAEADDPAATETVLVGGIPANKAHNGGRIAFGPENYLWVTTGDAELGDREKGRAQNLESLGGKVLRLRADGTAPSGNPDLGRDADPRIYTYGHRNPQGIAWLPDGTVLVTEHGQGGFDEVNRLVAGANYGWPEVRDADGYRDHPEVHRPVLSTRWNTWAPSGAAFYGGTAVPAWRNRLIIGGLVSQQVVIVTVGRSEDALPPTDGDDAKAYDLDWFDGAYDATAHTALRDRLGRVRHVAQSPDGDLYALTSNRDGRATDGFPRDGDDVLVRLEA